MRPATTGNQIRRFAVALLWGAVLVVGAGFGCAATPLPNPPDLDPPQPTQVDGEVVGGLVVPFTELMGRAGSAPPLTELWVTPLDTAGPVVVVAVDADGGFTATLDDVRDGSEIRLQARDGESRSAPVDAVVVSGARLGPARRPSCVSTAPALELFVASASPASLEVHNECAASIDVAFRLRRDLPEWRLEGAAAPIPEGGAVTVTVVVSPGGAEETLLIDVTGAAEGRLPVSLHPE